jgi:hypothetical protein
MLALRRIRTRVRIRVNPPCGSSFNWPSKWNSWLICHVFDGADLNSIGDILVASGL